MNLCAPSSSSSSSPSPDSNNSERQQSVGQIKWQSTLLPLPLCCSLALPKWWQLREYQRALLAAQQQRQRQHKVAALPVLLPAPARCACAQVVRSRRRCPMQVATTTTTTAATAADLPLPLDQSMRRPHSATGRAVQYLHARDPRSPNHRAASLWPAARARARAQQRPKGEQSEKCLISPVSSPLTCSTAHWRRTTTSGGQWNADVGPLPKQANISQWPSPPFCAWWSGRNAPSELFQHDPLVDLIALG